MTTDDLYDAVLAHLDGDDALWALDELATRARGLRTTLQLIDDACRRLSHSGRSWRHWACAWAAS
jgi:hypothetical protein